MEPVLRDALPYSNWVWVLGGALIVAAVSWVVSLAFAYKHSRASHAHTIRDLRDLQRQRYHAKIGEVQNEWAQGEMDVRDAHFALASLIRAAATEKTRVNVESLTAREAAAQFPEWQALSESLMWCEDQTFPARDLPQAHQRVERGLALAKAVVDQ